MKRFRFALVVMVAVVWGRVEAPTIAPAALVQRPVVEDTTRRYTELGSFGIRSLTGALVGFPIGAVLGASTALIGC